MMKYSGKLTGIMGGPYNNNFFIGRFVNAADMREYKVVGFADRVVSVGNSITFESEDPVWNDKYKNYQFEPASAIHVVIEGRSSVIAYLSGSDFPGIGPITAKKLYDAFGSDIVTLIAEDINKVRAKVQLTDKQAESLVKGAFTNGLENQLFKMLPSIKDNMSLLKPMTKAILGKPFESEIRRVASIDSRDIVRVLDFIKGNPYFMIHYNNIDLAKYDAVVTTDLGLMLGCFNRTVNIIAKALKVYVEKEHVTYLNVKNVNDFAQFYSYMLDIVRRSRVLSNTCGLPSGLFVDNADYLRYDAKLSGKIIMLMIQNYILQSLGSHGLFGIESKTGSGVRAFVPNDMFDPSVSDVCVYPYSVFKDKQSIVEICDDISLIAMNPNSPFSKVVKTRSSFLDNHLLAMKSGMEDKIDLNGEQVNSIKLAFDNAMSIISGGPGRGKTYVIGALIELWYRVQVDLEKVYGGSSSGKNGFPPRMFCRKYGNIVLLAPTGKAVDRLRVETGHTDCMTIRKFCMGNRRQSVVINYSQDNEPVFRTLKYDNVAKDPNTLIVVDESSMVDFADAAELLNIVKGCTIVWVGDKDQLPAIGIGSFFSEIIRSGCFPMTVLKQNMRVSNKSSTLCKNSDYVLEGRHVNELDHSDMDSFFVMNEKNNQGVIDDMINQYKTLLANGVSIKDIMLLAPMHVITDSLNCLIQDMSFKKTFNLTQCKLKFDNQLQRAYTDLVGCIIPTFKLGEAKIDKDSNLKTMIESSTMVGRIGDRVINRVNCTDLYWDTHVNDDFTKGVIDRGEGVFNGSIGTVVAFYPRSVNKNEDEAVLIRLDDGHFVMVESSLYVNWTLAYALTVHSAQGSEAHYVVLGLPAYEGPVSPWLFSGCNPFLSKNMIYTGITRAKLGVSIFGSIDIINRAIDSNIVPHNTCLAESLL